MFYDWSKILTYDCNVSIVIGARGIGKTYGLRKFCIKNDFLKRGKKYIEIVRYKNQKTSFMSNYFGRLAMDPDFNKYEFKIIGDKGYIREKSEDDKNKWIQLMRCVALTEAQQLKTQTFENVRRIIFDEFVLDPRMKQFMKYLPDEVSILQDVIDTISRETEETRNADKVRVMMLGNSLDALNPYFCKWDLYKDLVPGIKVFNHGKCALDYVPYNEEYANMKRDTVAFTFAEKNQSSMAANNEFVQLKESEFVKQKSEKAKCRYNITDGQKTFSVWLDVIEDKLYICDREVSGLPVIALTLDAGNPNNIIASRQNKIIKLMITLLYANKIYYDSKATQIYMLRMLSRYAILK